MLLSSRGEVSKEKSLPGPVLRVYRGLHAYSTQGSERLDFHLLLAGTHCSLVQALASLGPGLLQL